MFLGAAALFALLWLEPLEAAALACIPDERSMGAPDPSHRALCQAREGGLAGPALTLLLLGAPLG